MVTTAIEYERNKALNKLRSPQLRHAAPDERWRTKDWFGVSATVLHALVLQGELEHMVAESNGMDLWRGKQ